MRVAVLCATRRGHRFLRRLTELLPATELAVFSFREEPWEPRFFDDIRDLTALHGGQFNEARRVGHQQWESFWESTPVDLMFVISWRYLIPSSVFHRPRLGTYVIHDSLLPRYRGFAPTVWAIINGENRTGATLFEIAEQVDSGDIVDQVEVPIGPDDPIAEVMERMTEGYLQLLDRNLENLMNSTARRRVQDHTQATFGCKRCPEDDQIDWAASSLQVYNLIRAVGQPYPGAFTHLSGKRLRVWSARRVPDGACYVGRIPGRIVDVRLGEGSVVLTGDGSLLLKEVQVEGSGIVCAADVLVSLAQTLGR